MLPGRRSRARAAELPQPHHRVICQPGRRESDGGDDRGRLNATSVGLFPDIEACLAVETGSLRPGTVVADVIPNPPRTAFLRDAASRGCVTLDGLGMLVNQGVISIRHWPGIDPDPAVMRAALEDLSGS
jgi:shikimate dehydrogenase